MNIKRLVLGTAAGALAVTGAQAADLPVVVEPVDYVRVCDAFGTGYYYIPGTETCLRVAGRLRADYNIYSDDAFSDGQEILGTRGTEDTDDAYRFRARGYIYMDSRTSTEFGLLRTYNEFEFTFNDAGLGIDLNRGFIQFGGLTFGRTQSFYDFTDAYYGSAQTFNPGLSDTTTNLAAYTAAFGNGFSVSLSVEDQQERRGAISTTGRGGGNPARIINGQYEGVKLPEFVGNVRVDQGWGSAQLMGAIHAYDAQSFTFPTRSTDEVGFAVGGGVNVNVPFGNGTTAGIQAGYADGAIAYAADLSQSPSFGGTSMYADGYFDAAGNFSKSEAISVHGGFSTSFTPSVSLLAGGGYLYVDNGGTSAGLDLDFDGTVDNLDYSAAIGDVFLGYEPVSGLTLGVGGQYLYIDSDDRQKGDAGAFTGFFRAQRTF